MREVVLGLIDANITVYLYAKVCDLAEQEHLKFRKIRTPVRPFSISYPAFALVTSLRLAVDKPPRPWIGLGANVLNKLDHITVHFCHAGFRSVGYQRGQSGGRLHRLNSAIGKFMSLSLERWCYRPSRVASMTAVSRKLRSELLAHFDLAEIPIDVIENGVDLEHFAPRASADTSTRDVSSDREGLTAVFVGGDWERKGLAIAIDACARATWSLLVIGEGDTGRWANYAARASADVRFLGRKDPSDELKAGDAFLLPSLYEGFALVTLEAAASGLPILVTKATGAGELALRMGLPVLDRNADAFADGLRMLARDTENRLRIGRLAREVAMDFSWQKVRERYVAAYCLGWRSTPSPSLARGR